MGSAGTTTDGERPVAFLDRDGTLMVDTGYVSSPSQVELLPGAAEAVARLNQAGFPVAVVTNQSGVGRGYFGLDEYRAVAAELERQLARHGARVDVTTFCPRSPDDDRNRRKPKPDLYLEAAEALGRVPRQGVFVGDRMRDVAVAPRFGGQGWLVTAPAASDVELPPWLHRVESLADAVDQILGSAGATP